VWYSVKNGADLMVAHAWTKMNSIKYPLMDSVLMFDLVPGTKYEIQLLNLTLHNKNCNSREVPMYAV
jgi:hypothetical protein